MQSYFLFPGLADVLAHEFYKAQETGGGFFN